MNRRIPTLLAVAALALGAGGASPAASPLRVGFVTGAGVTPNRHDLGGLPLDGFIRAVHEYGVQGRVLQVAPNQDPTGALSLLARQRYDLVIVGVPDIDAAA